MSRVAPPCAERGLKWECEKFVLSRIGRSALRGAWIEIGYYYNGDQPSYVAPPCAERGLKYQPS